MTPSESSSSVVEARSFLEGGLISQRAALPRRLGIGLLMILYGWQEPLQMSFSAVESALDMHPAPDPHVGLLGSILVWYLLTTTGLVGRGAPHVWRSGYRAHAVLIALCGLAGIFLWYWGADLATRWGALYRPLRIANGLCLLAALVWVYWRAPALPTHHPGLQTPLRTRRHDALLREAGPANRIEGPYTVTELQLRLASGALSRAADAVIARGQTLFQPRSPEIWDPLGDVVRAVLNDPPPAALAPVWENAEKGRF